MKLSSLLFVTSFIPTITFKVIARMGEPTLSQARIATVIGLFLAIVQIIISKKVLKESTYLERAFLGFLAAGTLWAFAAPQPIAGLYVDYNTSLLYFVLFLTTLMPQLLGFDPFTFTMAKRWSPEAVWKTPQFLAINLHITYMFSAIMFAAFLSNVLGQGKPVYAIIVPRALIFGLGIPFSRMYPAYYLKRRGVTRPVISTADFPDTVKELILKMPARFNPEAAGSIKAQIQYSISGNGGGEFVLFIDNGSCSSHEGVIPDPDLLIESPADVWMKISRGEINAPQAMMKGLYKVQGDMDLLMNMRKYFS